MPTGLKRFYWNGDLHFMTASCYGRQPLLGAGYRKDLFVTVLEQVRQRYQLVVVGYVVMPEHFHLLISEPVQSNPSVVIQALKLSSDSHRRILFRFQPSLFELFAQLSESLVALLRSHERTIGTYDQVSGKNANLIGPWHLIFA
jgi:REP element-mobilizing transposase RayT